MGTRSTTHIVDHSGESPVSLARLYIQYDGYPTGVGNDIKNILGGKTLVNGYNDGATQINGAGCMAAMLIAGLKKGCGGVYLKAPTCEQEEEFNYTVTAKGPGEPIELRIVAYEKELYNGTLEDFDPQAVEEAA